MMPVMASEYGRNGGNDHDHDDRSVSTNNKNIVTAAYLCPLLTNDKY
jgi:hypothetical protein